MQWKLVRKCHREKLELLHLVDAELGGDKQLTWVKIKNYFKFKKFLSNKQTIQSTFKRSKTLSKLKTHFLNLNFSHHQPSCLPHLSPYYKASLSLSKTWYGNLISEISFNNKSAFIVSFFFSFSQWTFVVHKAEYYAKLAKDFTVNSFSYFFFNLILLGQWLSRAQ